MAGAVVGRMCAAAQRSCLLLLQVMCHTSCVAVHRRRQPPQPGSALMGCVWFGAVLTAGYRHPRVHGSRAVRGEVSGVEKGLMEHAKAGATLCLVPWAVAGDHQAGLRLLWRGQ